MHVELSQTFLTLGFYFNFDLKRIPVYSSVGLYRFHHITLFVTLYKLSVYRRAHVTSLTVQIVAIYIYAYMIFTF